MAHRTDPASPGGQGRHFLQRTSDAEGIKAPELGDMEAAIVHRSIIFKKE